MRRKPGSTPPPPPKVDRTRILVVDDCPLTRTLVARALDRLGYSSLTCRNGDAGLARISSYSADLVITDQNLPGRSGLEFISELRARGNSVPIILMTGEVGALKEPGRRNLSPLRRLEKPFLLEDLRRAVTEMLVVGA